jgi:hypothetical protein
MSSGKASQEVVEFLQYAETCIPHLLYIRVWNSIYWDDRFQTVQQLKLIDLRSINNLGAKSIKSLRKAIADYEQRPDEQRPDLSGEWAI